MLNLPADGSTFAYALTGMNTTGRSFTALKDKDKLLLGRHADEIASDPAVAEAAEKLGVRYVLLLDMRGSNNRTLYSNGEYQKEDWTGLLAMNDETAGYEPVLSEGDMRLYRISPPQSEA